MRSEASQLNERALEADDNGRCEEAESLFRQAISVDPSWSVPYFNLGLLYKKQRRWPECLEATLHTTAADPADEAGWWNLGIAATALGDWRIARRAWRGVGIEITEGDEPPQLGYGLVPPDQPTWRAAGGRLV